MTLTKEEREQLDALQAKEQEPDQPKDQRVWNVNVDLANPESVGLARRLGLDFGPDDEPEEEDDDDESDEPPKRRGYFDK